LKRHLPRTAVHVLTNGRRFSDPSFARAIARVRHPDLMLGVPCTPIWRNRTTSWCRRAEPTTRLSPAS
jgi:hypothetical protein